MSKNFFDDNWEEQDPETESEKDESTSGAKKTLFVIIDFLKTTIVVVVLALIIRIFIIQPFIVEGQSMLPTFDNNDYLITEKISYAIRPPQRGEVIIFHPPDNPSVNYVKRIVGLPGDEIEVKDGNVYVNSQKIVEPYLTSEDETLTNNNGIDIRLKADEYFVLGDNRNHSRDSREIGPIPKANIISRIWVRLLPIDGVRAFAAVDYEGLSK